MACLPPPAGVKGGIALKRYSEMLEAWEQEAYQDGYGADWLSDIGEGVKYYAMECEAKGRRPTFAGLIRYIDRKWCCPPEGEEDT